MLASFDLQSHSTFSDGQLTPADVVATAAASGLKLMALTDHDCIDGVQEAVAAGMSLGVRVVPAVEISAVDGAHEELHVLGYQIDQRSAGFADALVDLRQDRERRVLAMADRLRENGFSLRDDELRERQVAGLPLGRPQLATAVLAHPDNADRLRAEGISGARELFPAYLVPGAACYVPRSRPTVAQAIELIHCAGGVAVWAHPFWDITSDAEVAETLVRFGGLGLDGVEALYVTHDRHQTQLLGRLADVHSMIITGSSDFHGPDHEMFSRFGAFDTYGVAPRLGPLTPGDRV